MIPHNKPFFDDADLGAVARTMTTGQLAMGLRCEAVEKFWPEMIEAEAGAMVSSGLSALKLALRALKISFGDEVIISAYNCVALHNAVMATGATVVLADIEEDQPILSLESVIGKITPKTRAIITVHMFGHYSDPSQFMALGIPVIEDMCHMTFRQTATLAISSFYPTKFIGGSGGGIVSGKAELIETVKDWRSYGNKPPSEKQNDLPSELSASIVLSKLTKIEQEMTARAGIKEQYDNLFELDTPVDDMNPLIPYRYTLRISPHLVSDVVVATEKLGVRTMAPVTDYRAWVEWPEYLPNTDVAFDYLLSLPMYSQIRPEEQNIVANVVTKVLGDK